MGVKKVIVNGETIIDLSPTTLEAEEALAGRVFYTSTGEQATGTGNLIASDIQFVEYEVKQSELPEANQLPITITAGEKEAYKSVKIPPKDNYINPKGEIVIEENGDKDVRECNTAKVNVQPSLLKAEKTIESNGSVTYEIGKETEKDEDEKEYYGYSQITVNVDVKKDYSENTLTIGQEDFKENETTTIESETIKGIKQLYNEIQIPSMEELGFINKPTKDTLPYTENGTYDSGEHLGYEKIEVAVPLPERKTLEIDNIGKLDQTYGEKGSNQVYEKVIVSSADSMGLMNKPSIDEYTFGQNTGDNYTTEHLQYKRIKIRVPAGDGSDSKIEDIDLRGKPIEANGEYTYDPGRYDLNGFGKMSLSVAVPDKKIASLDKTIEPIRLNDTYTYTAANEGVDGFSEVKIKVDVNTEQHTVKQLEITRRDQMEQSYGEKGSKTVYDKVTLPSVASIVSTTPGEFTSSTQIQVKEVPEGYDGYGTITINPIPTDTLTISRLDQFNDTHTAPNGKVYNSVKVNHISTIAPLKSTDPITPTKSDQELMIPEGYYGYSQVTVKAVTTTPKTYTENGTFNDNIEYFIGKVTVNVPPTPEKINTEAEMEELLNNANNVGNIYKYTGKTANTFTPDGLYMVVSA